jgi:hypothetical protein
MMFREATIDEDEDKKCKRDCDVLEAALDQIGKLGNPTLSGLAKANFRQMRMFTVIALRQARSSYYASLVAASTSLLVLAFGGAVAVGVVPTSGKIAAGQRDGSWCGLVGLPVCYVYEHISDGCTADELLLRPASRPLLSSSCRVAHLAAYERS